MPINISSLGITWRLLPEENTAVYNTNNTYAYNNTYNNDNYYFSFTYYPKKEKSMRGTIMDIE